MLTNVIRYNLFDSSTGKVLVSYKTFATYALMNRYKTVTPAMIWLLSIPYPIVVWYNLTNKYFLIVCIFSSFLTDSFIMGWLFNTWLVLEKQFGFVQNTRNITKCCNQLVKEMNGSLSEFSINSRNVQYMHS